MKGETLIANATNPQSVTTVDDSRYKIDRATYSLIIISATISDTSTDYKCDLTVLNPVTTSQHVLQPLVILSLQVIGKYVSIFLHLISLSLFMTYTLSLHDIIVL